MNQWTPDDRLVQLTDAVCSGTIGADDLGELQRRLGENPLARAWYLDYFELHTELYWLIGRSRAAEGVERVDDVAPQVYVSCLGDLQSNTAGFFSSGWPAAYLIATVIFGIGLLIGSLVHVSQPAQVARQSAPLPSPPSPLPSIVGRITGMVDCKWEKGSGFRVQGSEPVVSGQWSVVSGQKPSESRSSSRQPPATSHLVSLGDKLALSSGLLEITYDTGAKVILQGPVTYQVESASGGFLSEGKLLGKVTGKTAKGFRIETPTAEVVDLGTEFGVDVAKDGTSEIHVLKGLVQTQFRHSSGQVSQPVQLREGEGRRYQCQSGQDTQPSNLVTVIPLDRAKFQAMHIRRPDERRERWLAYSRQLRKDPALVAYYSFESAGETNATLPNLSSAGNVLDGQVEGAEWVYGRFPGKFALYFHGPNSSDRVVLPEQQRFKFTGPFSVAVWFMTDRFTGKWQALVTKGDTSWRLQQDIGRNALSFETDRESSQGYRQKTPGQTDVADGRWHLAVVVCEPAGSVAKRRLYVDGRLDAENESLLPLRQNNESVWLGANSMSPQCEFQGLIDEAAIFARALSADEVAMVFEAGSPAGKSPNKPHNGK